MARVKKGKGKASTDYTRDDAISLVKNWETSTGREADIGHTGPYHHAQGIFKVIDEAKGLFRFMVGVIGDKEKFVADCNK